MPRLTAEIIATVCGKGRRTTRGYFKCCCPAHDDQRPSLLIYVKDDGRLSFRRLAGCPTRRIKIVLRQRGFDLSRVKKQTVSETQDGLLWICRVMHADVAVAAAGLRRSRHG